MAVFLNSKKTTASIMIKINILQIECLNLELTNNNKKSFYLSLTLDFSRGIPFQRFLLLVFSLIFPEQTQNARGYIRVVRKFYSGEYEFKQFKASSNLLPSLSFLTIFLVAATK